MFYHNINPVLVQIGPLQIRYYGIVFALGFLLAYYLIYYLAKRRRISITKDDAADLIVYLIVGAVVGARLAYVFVYNPFFYLRNPFEIIAVWHGGLSFHGGFIGAITSSYIFCRRKRADFWKIADIVVIPLALGLAFGRIANFINGELTGRITNAGWCVDYSRNQFIENPPSGCRHPSQIYESLKNFLIFGVLWVIKDKKLPKGFMFWAFVALYGLLRTVMEFFREPDEQIGFLFGNFTMGQLLSIPLLILGFIMLIYKSKSNL